MKILQCHNLYQLPGGEDRVAEDEQALLRAHGHTVLTHTVHNDRVNDLSRLRLAVETVWSRRSAQRVRELVRREQPQIVHFHNTLPQLSPSCYYAAHAEGAAVVQTLHNYRLLCPKATFFRDDQICEKCLHKTVKWPAVVHRCYRDSRSASGAVAAMLTAHGLAGTYRRTVDAYIACSEFTRDKMIEGGFEGDRIHYKPNFVPTDPGPGAGGGGGGYPLYLGRLTQDKGIPVLVEAWKRLPDTPLFVVGKGPEEANVEALTRSHPGVRYENWIGQPRLGQVLGDAAFLVLPTMNYEGFPKVIVEAYAHGVPVVASDLGAMSRVVVDGETGRHVPHGDPQRLAEVVEELLGDPPQLARLRRGARRAYENHYNAAVNYRRLMEIYQAALDRGPDQARRRANPMHRTAAPQT